MTTPFRLALLRDGSGTVVACEGELDILTSEQLRTGVERALAERPASLTIDCTRVDFIDSVGIRALLHAASSGRERGAEVRFRHSPQVQRIVNALGLRERLPHGEAASAA